MAPQPQLKAQSLILMLGSEPIKQQREVTPNAHGLSKLKLSVSSGSPMDSCLWRLPYQPLREAKYWLGLTLHL